MRFSTSVWAGVALLAFAQGAQAAAPTVSGKYAVMIFEQCTAAFNAPTATFAKPGSGGSGPAVTGINTINNGEIGIEVGTFTFPSAASTSGAASVALTHVHGDALRVNSSGPAVTVKTESLNGTFSLTATTFSFTPTGQSQMVWTASYGNINPPNGLVRTVYMVRKDGASCLQGITLTKQ